MQAYTVKNLMFKMNELDISEKEQPYTVPLETETVTFRFMYMVHDSFKKDYGYDNIDPVRDCIGGKEYYSMLDTHFSDTFEVVCDENNLKYEDFFFYYRNGDTVNGWETPTDMKIPADNCINIYLHMSIFTPGGVFESYRKALYKQLKEETEKEEIWKATMKSRNEQREAEHLLFLEEVKRKKARNSMFYKDRLD
jgi:hypothetical protein